MCRFMGFLGKNAHESDLWALLEKAYFYKTLGMSRTPTSGDSDSPHSYQHSVLSVSVF